MKLMIHYVTTNFYLFLFFLTLFLGALKTRDITIRRECTQILYMICNKKTVHKIVPELLSYLQKTINDNIDFTSRDELVLKISILSEKYSDSNSWYLSIINSIDISLLHCSFSPLPSPRYFFSSLPPLFSLFFFSLLFLFSPAHLFLNFFFNS